SAAGSAAAGSAALHTKGGAPPQKLIRIPAGPATLGSTDAFGWDNEFPARTVAVPAFEMQRLNVTNAAYLEYMNETGAPAPHFWNLEDDRWFWRGMFELVPLPLDWPVYATHDQAAAYARWAGGRLPAEAEYNLAAEGTPLVGNFDFARLDPVPAGSISGSVSRWGAYDLVGNGWEWTSTVFEGFPGFKPMRSYPQYSTDFFDGQHYVLKGASPVTAREMVRISLRNWFRPNYPYLYATFRCVF
ncbi:MAG TPA: SUMF1/EgtB/PvdO family nonheme iron enzyme, partial [Thermoanaerobaculia bacterium]|nr:SUMF1/EgtB/PvdO family nonheme iron enzyme [Thermoanaerobaculia bacterium]